MVYLPSVQVAARCSSRRVICNTRHQLILGVSQRISMTTLAIPLVTPLRLQLRRHGLTTSTGAPVVITMVQTITSLGAPAQPAVVITPMVQVLKISTMPRMIIPCVVRQTGAITLSAMAVIPKTVAGVF